MPDPAETLPPDHLDVAFDPQDLKRRSVQGGAATFGAQALKFFIRFGSAVVVARFLSPAEFGLVAMVSPILGFVSTLNDLGFGQAIIRAPEITARQISALFWRNLLLSIGLAAGLSLVAPLVGRLYHEPRTISVTIALGGLLILSTLGIVPNALLKRELRFLPLVSIDLVSLITGAVVTVATAIIGLGYWSLVIGQLASSLASVLLAFGFARWIPSKFVTDPTIRSFMRFGANLTVVNIATYFSMTADNMIVGVVVGKEALGLYDRSYTLTIQPLNQLLAPVSQLSIPLLSRLQHVPDLYRRSYQNMLRLSLMLIMPAMLFCVILAKPLIVLMLGAKWQAAAPVFAWVCFGGIVAPIFSSTGWVFTTQNRTGEQMRFSVTTALISIASFALGVRWGIVGVASVSALSFTFIQVPLMIYAMTRRGVISLRDVVRTLAPFFASAALIAIPLYYLRKASGPIQLPAIGALSYALFLLCLYVLPGGRDLLKMILGIGSTLRRSNG
jgi:polysaccharide transporter, PST family